MGLSTRKRELAGGLPGNFSRTFVLIQPAGMLTAPPPPLSFNIFFGNSAIPMSLIVPMYFFFF